MTILAETTFRTSLVLNVPGGFSTNCEEGSAKMNVHNWSWTISRDC